MDQALSITTQVRSCPGTKGLLTQLRKEGWIPSVLYGCGKETETLSISEKEFLKELKKVGIYKKAFMVNGQKAFVKSMEFEPVKDRLLHIDFIRAL
jgi:large subunit ribosomal protein L25